MKDAFGVSKGLLSSGKGISMAGKVRLAPKPKKDSARILHEQVGRRTPEGNHAYARKYRAAQGSTTLGGSL